MELKSFSNKIIDKMECLNININEYQISQLYNYMKLLIKWNEKMNLTAITEPNDIVLKHFIDSITINNFIEKNSRIIDIGTGAGFPGVPIKVIRDDVEMVLMDSLNKRILFLEEVINNLKLKKIVAIHNRAEDLGKNKEYRQKFDYAISRAVAPLNYLLEYMIPFIKGGGYCICMKGCNIEEELDEAKNAISKLGGKLEKIEKIKLPQTEIERNIIIIKKVKDTPNQYPRKAGIPKKQPI